MFLIKNLIFSLFITILIETIVAIILGFRKKEQIYVIQLMNVITNLTIVYTMYCIIIFFNIELMAYYSILFILEILVWIIEAIIIKQQFKYTIKKSIYISFILNIASFGTGEIFKLIGVNV